MRRRRPNTAFTLIELLVVISIIGILLAILLPVVGSIKKRARATDSLAQIAQLEALITAYHADFNAYPGPIPNAALRRADNSAATPTFITPATLADKITMSENLYLALQGGLKLTNPGVAVPIIAYDVNLAGKGPQSLGPIPKQYPPYGDNANVSKGKFVDDSGATADDTDVPEYVDRFPYPLPILYLRARAGVPSLGGTVVTTTAVISTASSAQYDQTQVTPYTGPAAGPWIGEGKENDGEPRLPAYQSNDPQYYHHGFNNAPAPLATLATEYPYNINAALKNPTFTDTPKQKDRFILISPGIDRIYGTKDDITNFGGY